ncbi:MAG: hypothetical protein F6K39_36370 [Okeania sp. SIO3B3]|nr:hypothetical protein [Okeania sp. SIO3B3]
MTNYQQATRWTNSICSIFGQILRYLRLGFLMNKHDVGAIRIDAVLRNL